MDLVETLWSKYAALEASLAREEGRQDWLTMPSGTQLLARHKAAVERASHRRHVRMDVQVLS